MTNPAIEMQELLERFGGGVQLVFDGSASECPICHHHLYQLALAFEESEFGSTSCENCGAVLAA